MHTFYHGSPVAGLKTLRAGSFVTPDLETARLMGRFYTNTGKTWSDDDLEEKHIFGQQPKWKAGREPDGVPNIYQVTTDTLDDIDLLNNPYEHTLKKDMAVALYNDKLRAAITQAVKTATTPVLSSLTNMANSAIQHPMGQTALGHVAGAYNTFMPQAGKDMVKNMVPNYASPTEMQEFGMQEKWQPEPFIDKSFEQGINVASESVLNRTTTNGQHTKQFSNRVQSAAPVEVTGTPLHQIGYGLSGGVMPGQTFQPGTQAYNTQNLAHTYDSTKDTGINTQLTWSLTPTVPEFQKQNSLRFAIKEAVEKHAGPWNFNLPAPPKPPAAPSTPQPTIPKAPTFNTNVTLPRGPALAAQNRSGDFVEENAIDQATPAWRGWLDRNYQGWPRMQALGQINQHLQQHPGAYDRYQQITDTKFTNAQRTARHKFEIQPPEKSPTPLVMSNVHPSSFRIDPHKVTLGNEKFIGEQHAQPWARAVGAVGQHVLPFTPLTQALGAKNLYLPAMTRGLTGVHEMEHVNQSDAEGWDRFFLNPRVARTFASEAPAVMNEMVHGVDAARQATGKPVPGNFALTPNYQPSLEWMRQQAQQHGLQGLGPQTAGKTMTELLNTPAGQAWLRMQMRDLSPPPQNTPGTPNDVPTGGLFEPVSPTEKESHLQQWIKEAVASASSAASNTLCHFGRKQAALNPAVNAPPAKTRTFYHGSAAKNLASILEHGLDPEFAGTGADSGVPTNIPGYEKRIFLATHPQLKSGYGDTKFKITLPEDFPVQALFSWPFNKVFTDHYTTQKIPSHYIEHMADEKKADLQPWVQLQPHQQRVADRISGPNPRMLVYHGLGTGKSLAAIAAAEAAKKNSGGDYAIVAPASLRDNFRKEIDKFTTGSKPEILSYTGLGMGRHPQNNPETLIFDEAHRLRNPEGLASLAAVEAAKQAPRVALLTGSPITNHPTDLANLLTILRNEKITPEKFEEKFIDYKKVKPGWGGWLRGVKPGEEVEVKNPEGLKSLLRGHVDYNPGKSPEGVDINEQIVDAPLTAEQEKIQKALRTKIPPRFLWKLDKEFPLSREELGKLNSFLTGMRQVSLSTQPFRADGDYFKAFEQSGKLQTALSKLRETLDSDPRRKALIYSNYIDAGLQPYAAALAKNNIPHAIFHGGIPLAARRKALEDYNAGKLRALLIGPAGAEGISTKGTSLIQLLDPHWNETRSQQAQGRGLRFDSHRDLPEELKNVAIQRFISRAKQPGWFRRKILGAKPERTGDEILDTLAKAKEKANDKFRDVLKQVGTESQQEEMARQLYEEEGPARKAASLAWAKMAATH